MLSFCRTLPHISIRPIHAVHIVMPELYEYSSAVLCVRSCACVYVLICESVMNCSCVNKNKVFEGILLVKTNPPSVKAGYGPGYQHPSTCMHTISIQESQEPGTCYQMTY